MKHFDPTSFLTELSLKIYEVSSEADYLNNLNDQKCDYFLLH